MKTNPPLFAVPMAFLALWTFVAPARAAAPSEMTYQGRLKEGGLPVTGTRGVEIAVCSDPIAAPGCIFTGSQNVAVANGLFKTTFTMSGWDPAAGPWYLEVRVNAVALTPREPLTSTPYALYASSAATLVASTGTAGVFISTHLFIVNAGAAATDAVFQASSGTAVGQELLVVRGDGTVGVAGALDAGARLALPADALREIRFPTGTGNIEIESSNQMVLGTYGNSDVLLQSNAQERVRISSAGNVGIGVVNPMALLHVGSGSVRISTSAVPALPPAAEAGLYYSSMTNRLMVSQNGEAFRKLLVMEQLGVVTLGAGAASISLTGLAPRQTLVVYLLSPGKSAGSSSSTVQFNADSATNYAYRLSNNGGADTTSVSQTQLGFTATNTPEFVQLEIFNPMTEDKIIIGTRGDANGSGAAVIPQRDELLGKWVSGSQVTGIQFNTSTGNFLSGTTLVVLGSNY